MNTFHLKQPAVRQRGFVALFIMLAVLVSAGSFLTIRLWGASSNPQLLEVRQQAAFKLAKDALLAYVVDHGRFPCPAKVNGADIADKEAWPDCSNTGVSQIGLLPWRYLNIDPAFTPELCIWYAVSGHMIKTTTWSYPVNNDSSGAFKVVDTNGNILQGSTLATNATVVLIAPNAPITSAGHTQNRNYTGVANKNLCKLADGTTVAAVAKQYLDTATVTINGTPAATLVKNWDIPATKIDPHDPLFPQTTVTNFVQGYVNRSYPNNNINDHLSWISTLEFSRAISQHAANRAALALTRFYKLPAASGLDNKFYPFAANATNGNCVAGLLAGNLPKQCDDKRLASTKSWTDYRNNSPAFDATLNYLIDDEWDQRLWYQLSAKCQYATADCGGAGNYLPAVGNLVNVHTSVLVAPRGAVLPYNGTLPAAAKAFTR